MAKKKSDHKTALRVGIGLSVAAVSALAGAYFTYKKAGPKTQRKMRGWVLKMRGEVLEQLEGLKEINEKAYNTVVDEVGKRYLQMQNIDSKDVNEAVGELRGHWKKIVRDLHKKQKRKRVGKKKVKTSKKAIKSSKKKKSS